MLEQINIQDVVRIAKSAGASIMQIYNQGFQVGYKQDASPLTLADKRSHQIIKNGLAQLSVQIPILSEEGECVPYSERKLWEYFWLVDPLDGTKEFIKKNDEFTVNIALIHESVPVLGVVYAPALDICYWAKHGQGAFKDGRKLPIKTKEQRKTCKIVASRSHMSDDTRLFIASLTTDKAKELVSVGSSLKICLVAEGEADVYPRLAPTMEWDTGAAHAIVNESGSFLMKYMSDGSMRQHKYNKSDLLNASFIVLNA